MIDLHPTVGMAAGLALDTLLDKVLASCRRVWMGDPAVVEANGGILRETFTDQLTVREFVWPSVCLQLMPKHSIVGHLADTSSPFDFPTGLATRQPTPSVHPFGRPRLAASCSARSMPHRSV